MLGNLRCLFGTLSEHITRASVKKRGMGNFLLFIIIIGSCNGCTQLWLLRGTEQPALHFTVHRDMLKTLFLLSRGLKVAARSK